MKFPQLAAVALISALAAAGTVAVLPPRTSSQAAAVQETAYRRVMRTGTLRCGYSLYTKIFERDFKTGAFSGIYVDLLEELGKQLNLKIEWTEEVGLSNAFAGLQAQRYDVMCFPFNQTPGRARATEFTTPFFFAPFFVYVRADDTRFDNAVDKINDPSVRFAFLDGEFAQILRNEKFPKSQPVSMPDLTDISQVLMQVATGKAAVTATAPSTAEPFLIHNPGKIRRVIAPPMRMQPLGLDVAVGENELRAMLDTTIRALLATGAVEKIIGRYATASDQFFLPERPWGDPVRPTTTP